MTLVEYQEKCKEFAQYPKEVEADYLALGFYNEAGELAGKIKKQLRGDKLPALPSAVLAEAGDVLWYLAMDANYMKQQLHKDDERIESLASNGPSTAQLVTSLFNPSMYDLAVDILGAILKRYGFTLEDAMSENVAKLQDRKERNVIKGSGDNR